jgi:site-specific recombinase XerD
MRLLPIVGRFFSSWLSGIKGASPNTSKTYREAFSLLLPFVARRAKVEPRSLTVEHLSRDAVLDFLHFLEKERGVSARTRNCRLAAIKSFAAMLRLMHPEKRPIADAILDIPQKRETKKPIGWLYPDEVAAILKDVDLKRPLGFRDWCMLRLLYDSGARASEIANLNLDSFDPRDKTLSIMGKGARFRQIEIEDRTAEALEVYVQRHRKAPAPTSPLRLFVSLRGAGLTRHGIYRVCDKYLKRTLSAKRLADLNPVHSFRHGCAVRMLASGRSIVEIKNRLGHQNVESTMVYLNLDVSALRRVQKRFEHYAEPIFAGNAQIEEMIDWENRQEVVAWLDSL